MAINKVLQSILLSAFADETAERRLGVQQSERDERMDTAIFICTLAFPHMPTILHIFEPRYRLMLRRCIESANPRFGMILPARGGATEYGTMLEIRSIQTLNDGRSMVETVGSWRFKVLEKGGLDGYTVGRVERIDDISSEDEAEREAAAIARGRESRRNSTASSSGLGSTASTADYSNAPSTSSGGSRLPSSFMSSFPASFGDTISDGSIPPQHSSIPTSAPMLRPPQVAASSSTADVSSSTSIPSSIATDTEPAPSFDMVASSLVQPKRNPADLSTQALMDICEAFIDHLRSGSAPWLLQRLNNTYGPMPDDPTTCSYWMASVIPIDEYEKAKLLPIRSPRLRLALIVHWIEQLQGSWWFSSGCVCA